MTEPTHILEGVDVSDISSVIDQLEEFREALANGLLEKLLPTNNTENQRILEETLGKDFDVDDLRETVIDAMENMATGTCTLKDAFGITPEGMEAFYYIGFTMFQKGDYPSARKLFKLLIELDPLEARYYHAIAAVQHKQKDYLVAVQNYMCAFAYSPVNDPEIHYHCADCYLKMEDLTSAILSLGHCIEACDVRNEKHKMIRDKSIPLREALIQRLKEEADLITMANQREEASRQRAREREQKAPKIPDKL
jgi:type III secretion system low calcium response chaperone LcrH/SycD